jgi:hypothetical protein
MSIVSSPKPRDIALIGQSGPLRQCEERNSGGTILRYAECRHMMIGKIFCHEIDSIFYAPRNK